MPHSGKDAWASGSCSGSTVSRNYLYQSSWELRHRIGWTSRSPQIGVHSGRHSESFHSNCHQQAGRVARDMNRLGTSYPPSSSDWSLTWVGDIGVRVCKPGWHRYGLAVDLTRFSFGEGRFVDTNRHWRDSRIRLRRRYLAVIASARKHFGTVLHGHNDPDGSHINHIHVDRGRHAVSLNKNNRTDTIIVQWAARDIAEYSSMAIDGIWGPQTQSGYDRLMSRFKLRVAYGGCYNFNPLSTPAHQRVLMDFIGRTAFANKVAGYYTAATPPCPD